MKYQLTQSGTTYTLSIDGVYKFSSGDFEQCKFMYEKMVLAAKENKSGIIVIMEDEV